MEFEKGDRVVVKKHGPGEVIGHLGGGTCVTVKLDRGDEMHVHRCGVEPESEGDFRSKEKA